MTTEKKIPKGCVCNLLSTATCARGSFRCDRRHKVTTADQDTLRAELDAARAREEKLRDALTQIAHGGPLEGQRVASPMKMYHAQAVARAALAEGEPLR